MISKTYSRFILIGMLLFAVIFSAQKALASEKDVVVQSSTSAINQVVQGSRSNAFTVTYSNNGTTTVTVELYAELDRLNATSTNQKIVTTNNKEITLAPHATATLDLVAAQNLSVGTYELRAGVFNKKWNGLVHWYNKLQVYTVTPPSSEDNNVELGWAILEPSLIHTNEVSHFNTYLASKNTDNTELVDVALMDTSGHLVVQKFLDNQHFTKSQTMNVEMNSPLMLTPGTYYYSVGIFTPHWARQVHWYNNVKTLTVTR
jgi:hypothetical protein